MSRRAGEGRGGLRAGPVAARASALLVMGALALGLANESAARVGGGQDFSGPSPSSGSGGGSRGTGGGGGRSGGGSSSSSSGRRAATGGGGGGDVGWLFLDHPYIAFAFVTGWLAIFVYSQRPRAQAETLRAGDSELLPADPPRPPPPPGTSAAEVRRPAGPAGLKALQARDPTFSLPLFIDFALLVIARAHRAGGAASGEASGDAALAPWLTGEARRRVRLLHPSGSRVLDVIVGAARLHQVDVTAARTRVTLDIRLNLLSAADDEQQQALVEERWTFSRAAGVVSPPPRRLVVLCCAGCGSAAEPRPDGACESCGVPRTDGASHWVVSDVDRARSEEVSRPALRLGGGVEAGTQLATVFAPDLAAARSAFEARHPEFSWEGFRATVVRVFLRLQAAWASGEWEGARPFETDALFQQHRFWMERSARTGLRNANADVAVDRVEICAVGRDAWLESITVRVFARMKDWTEERWTGEVVGGSRTEPRVFSEYWTFVRAVGGKRRAGGGADSCPACSAPLDRVSMAGVCGSCEAHITSGEFDWVLSRIEQDEVYEG
jgi:predicted lipid-binding transport protein (Tim44 family)